MSLFDGIGALRVALDALRVPVGGYVSVEISPEANRVVESYFPDVVCIEDVAAITEEQVIEWRLRFASVGLVLLRSWPAMSRRFRAQCRSEGGASRSEI